MVGYTIKHRDEFESMEGLGEATWRLARKAPGTSAFGFNLVEIDPGGQYAAPAGTLPRSSRRPHGRSSIAPTRPSPPC